MVSDGDIRMSSALTTCCSRASLHRVPDAKHDNTVLQCCSNVAHSLCPCSPLVTQPRTTCSPMGRFVALITARPSLNSMSYMRCEVQPVLVNATMPCQQQWRLQLALRRESCNCIRHACPRRFLTASADITFVRAYACSHLERWLQKNCSGRCTSAASANHRLAGARARMRPPCTWHSLYMDCCRVFPVVLSPGACAGVCTEVRPRGPNWGPSSEVLRL